MARIDGISPVGIRAAAQTRSAPTMTGAPGAGQCAAPRLALTEPAPELVRSAPVSACSTPATAGAADGVTELETMSGPNAAPAARPRAQATVASQLIERAAADTAGSQLAQQVMSALDQGGAVIDVVDESAFAAQYGRAAGLYDPNTKRIALPSDVAADPERLRLILLHEGVHWLQDNVDGGAEALGGAIGQALRGAGAVKDTVPNSKADSQHDEAQAYLIEALMANELGVRDRGLGVDGSGKALGYDQILARVKATPEYA